jgi:hypothetical protein
VQLYQLRGCGRVAEDLDALQALMQHPDAVNISRVDLRYLQVDSAALADWLRHAWLSGVTALDLHDHRLTSHMLDVLAANPAAADLRVLAVSGRDDISHTVRMVTAHPVMEGLEVLDFAGSPLGDRGARLLAESPAVHRLRGLNLRRTGIGATGVAALLAAGLPSMVRLDLSENPIGDDAARTFSDADLPALSRLDLGYPHNDEAITDHGAHHLARAELPQLTDLGVEFHAIADAGATALAARPGLRLLRICHGNRITSSGGEAVAHTAGPHLRLDLSPVCNPALRDHPALRASSLAGPPTNKPVDPFDTGP